MTGNVIVGRFSEFPEMDELLTEYADDINASDDRLRGVKAEVFAMMRAGQDPTVAYMKGRMALNCGGAT